MGKQIIQKVINATLKNEAGQYSLGKALGTGLMIYSPIAGYGERRDAGEGVVSSLVKTAGEEALLAMTGFWPYMGYELLKNSGALVEAGESLATQRRAFYADSQYQAPFRTNTFVDNEQLYTMRQAGVALAQQTKYKQVATLMGNEARYMHR